MGSSKERGPGGSLKVWALAVIACVIGALALSACGGGSSSSSTEAGGSSTATGGEESGGGGSGGETHVSSEVSGEPVVYTEAPAELGLTEPSPKQCPAGGETIKIGYDRYSDTDPNVLAMSSPLEAAFKAMGCVELISLTDNLDPSTVLRNMQTFIQRGVDGVILQNALIEVQPAARQLLKNANIPVIAISIPAPEAPFVGPNDYENGVLGGREAAKVFEKRFPNTEPQAVLLELPKSGETPKQRHDGFLAGIKEVFPELAESSVTNVSAEATETSAHDETVAALARLPEGKKLLVAGVNDSTAQGMLQGVKQAGRESETVVVGQGGHPPISTQYLCEEPEWAGTVANFPEKSGVLAATGIVDLVAGKEIPEFIAIPGAWETRENIGKYYPSAAC